MRTRIVVGSLLAVALVGAAASLSAAPTGDAPTEDAAPVVKVVSGTDVEEKQGGQAMRATTVEVRFPAGTGSPPHRHPGALYGYVLEGRFEFKVAGKPARTLKAGETFYEPAMILHELGRNPSEKEPARVLAIIVHPRDAQQLVIPEPPPAAGS